MVEVESDGGPGSIMLTGLPSNTTLNCTVRNSGIPTGGMARTFTTLAPPPGRELFRFATISDMHIGEVAFGWRGSIIEDPPNEEPFPIRATRAAINELTRWGAQLLVVKGDVTSSGRLGQWATFAGLVHDLPFPVEVIPGNHDAGLARPSPQSPRAERSSLIHGPQISTAEAFAEFNLGVPDPVRSIDLPGLRLVMTETDRLDNTDKRGGDLNSRVNPLLEHIGSTTIPVMVAMHHQPMPLPIPHHLPLGIPMSEARAFLRRARVANPALMISAAHTHRHRRRRMEKVPIAEVGAVKDYPGTWAGYVVHEGGIRQVVRRIATPDLLTWTDRSARAAFGLWGWWSPGTLSDRCFTLTWPERGQ